MGLVHVDTLISVWNLAKLLEAEDKSNEALTLYKDAVTSSQKLLGDKDPLTLTSISNLASCLEHLNRLMDAEGLLRQVLDEYREKPGGSHPITLTAIANLGEIYDLYD